MNFPLFNAATEVLDFWGDAGATQFERADLAKLAKQVKMLIRHGVKRVEEEHQEAIAEKQHTIDELNDDLTETEEYGRQLEHDKWELQGEIRAKDQEIDRRRKEIAELRERYVDHCQDPRKDNLVVITQKKLKVVSAIEVLNDASVLISVDFWGLSTCAIPLKK